MTHIRSKTYRATRTKFNFTNPDDAPVATLCGAAPTADDLALSDIVRGGKIGPTGRKNLAEFVRCDDCRDRVTEGR